MKVQLRGDFKFTVTHDSSDAFSCVVGNFLFWKIITQCLMTGVNPSF